MGLQVSSPLIEWTFCFEYSSLEGHDTPTLFTELEIGELRTLLTDIDSFFTECIYRLFLFLEPTHRFLWHRTNYIPLPCLPT